VIQRFLLLSFLLLSGCTATSIPYSAQLVQSDELAAKIIEQVVMEQPLKYRPEGVVITKDYLGVADGIEVKGHSLSSGVVNSQLVFSSINLKTLDVSTRYYFNSLSRLELYSKRDWYIVQLKNDEHHIVKRFYTRRLDKAERLIDSINHMMASAKAFGTQ